MELSFAPKAESGWRGRGAPRRNVPEQVLEMLRRTDGAEVGVIDTRGDADEDVAEMISYLRRGARQMGRTLRLQHNEEDSRIMFQLAPRKAAS